MAGPCPGPSHGPTKSLTRSWAPKPSATPTMPALAIIGARSMPNSDRMPSICTAKWSRSAACAGRWQAGIVEGQEVERLVRASKCVLLAEHSWKPRRLTLRRFLQSRPVLWPQGTTAGGCCGGGWAVQRPAHEAPTHCVPPSHWQFGCITPNNVVDLSRQLQVSPRYCSPVSMSTWQEHRATPMLSRQVPRSPHGLLRQAPAELESMTHVGAGPPKCRNMFDDDGSPKCFDNMFVICAKP